MFTISFFNFKKYIVFFSIIFFQQFNFAAEQPDIFKYYIDTEIVGRPGIERRIEFFIYPDTVGYLAQIAMQFNKARRTMMEEGFDYFPGLEIMRKVYLKDSMEKVLKSEKMNEQMFYQLRKLLDETVFKDEKVARSA